jgi:2-dehydro-3-deoxyphosphooctonate aldolase (KDO 8-P synthase)
MHGLPPPAVSAGHLMRIGAVPIGGAAPLAWISGLNVLETSDAAVACAESLQELAARRGLPLVFKASFDKANRTHGDAYRGPGIDAGLEMLARVKGETGLPLMTDVHEPGQAAAAAEVVDCLQIPAFLVRQTELVAACAATGLPLNLKRGQFIAPAEMRHAVDKAMSLGATEVLVSERGSSFGFNDLVVDMRGLVTLAEFAPVCFDATHSAQRPGVAGGASGGDRRMVAPLSRAAVAAGVDALFVETHPNPDDAPCDAACQLDFAALEALVAEVTAIRAALDG